MIKIGCKFRIYPTEKQKEMFENHFGCCRFIYNYFLDLRQNSYKKYKLSVSGVDTANMLKKLKQQKEFVWLNEVNSQSLQASVFNLESAYHRFFKKKGDYPTFKRKTHEQKFKIPQHFKLQKSKRGKYFLTIPKLKDRLYVNLHREIKGDIKFVTISKISSGKYFVSFNCEADESVITRRKDNRIDSVGIDLGLTSFIATDDGQKEKSPKFLRKCERKLKSAQRELSRRKEGSKNWEKSRLHVATIHEKIFNQRSNFLHKLSFRLVDENQVIFLEDLNVKGMMKNRHLSKSIADASWGKFGEMLKYKSEWRDKHVIQIGRWEASTKICHVCKYQNDNLKLSDRYWICPVCGTRHDRDINSAKNVKIIGWDTPEWQAVLHGLAKPAEKPTSTFSLKSLQAGSKKQEPVLEATA